jgi:hypothetical protein
MFEQAFKYVGLQLAKFQFRSEMDTMQPMTNFLRTAKNVLITLPAGYDEAIFAGNAMRKLRQRLENPRMTVIHTSTRTTSLADFQKCEVVRIDPSDINRFSLPTRGLLQRIFPHEYDVAVDLNLDFVLHTAYICKVSRARVRVGFGHPSADAFFNVLVNVNKEQPPQALYEHFASCLAMF